MLHKQGAHTKHLKAKLEVFLYIYDVTLL